MQKKMCVEPVTLKGQRVILAPLELGHVPALSRVGLDASLWEWIPAPVTTEQEMRGYVLSALELQGRGVALPFAILDRASGDVIGSTRYANIESAHRRLEIGGPGSLERTNVRPSTRRQRSCYWNTPSKRCAFSESSLRRTLATRAREKRSCAWARPRKGCFEDI